MTTAVQERAKTIDALADTFEAEGVRVIQVSDKWEDPPIPAFIFFDAESDSHAQEVAEIAIRNGYTSFQLQHAWFYRDGKLIGSQPRWTIFPR